MNKETIHVEIERGVKHSVRYREPGSDWIIYIPKDKLGKHPYPKAITITLEPSHAQ